MREQVTRRDMLRKSSALAGIAGIASTAGCQTILGGGSTESVTISSKSFTEQRILGHLTSEVLKQKTDVEVEEKIAMGGTVTNFEALKNKESDLYWEYTGTAWATLEPQHEEAISDSDEIYKKAKSDMEEEYSITFLKRAPFNNTYVLLARSEWAEQKGISSISDFATWVKDGHTDKTIVTNAEFEQRSDGWPGMIKHYAFEDAAKKLDITNVSSSLTYQVIGSEEAVAGSGTNTNPKITKFDLTALDDNKDFFPVYNPAPMTRQEVLDENPAIEEPLNEVANSLTTETIRGLNKKVAIDEKDARKVATKHLKDEGIL